MEHKPKPDSLEAELAQAGRKDIAEALERWLFDEQVSYIDCIGRLRSQFGYKLKSTRTTGAQIGRLHSFYVRRRATRSAARILDGKQVADTINALGSMADLDAATLKAASALALHIATSNSPDIESLQKLVTVLLKHKQLDVDREKLDLLKRKAEQADKARTVANSETLTPEQKLTRIKEVFGL